MLIPPVAAQWCEGAGVTQGPAAPDWLPEAVGAQAASCPVSSSTHVYTHGARQSPNSHSRRDNKLPQSVKAICQVACCSTSQSLYLPNPNPGQCFSTSRLTMIAFNSRSHFFTLWPLTRVMPSTRGQPLGVLGRPSLSLTVLQGVGLSPASSGIPACLMSQAAKLWAKPAADDRSDGCRPDPNCAEQQQAGRCVVFWG